MKIARLKILGIDAKLGQNESYHDDGFVSCLMVQTQILCGTYPCESNFQNQLFIERKNKTASGVYLPLATPIGWEHHIYYRDRSREAGNLSTRAHEETHVLQELNGLGILAQKLLENQRVLIDFDSIDNREVVADLGAVYALVQCGFKLETVRRMYRVKKNFDVARRMYKQSMLPRKRVFV